MTTRARMISEGVKRLRMLNHGMFSQTVRAFKDGVVMVSSRIGFNDSEIEYPTSRINAAIAQFEKETGNLVYHALYNRTIFGEIISLLYVSADESEWAAEKSLLERKEPNVFLVNLNNPFGNEYNKVAIRKAKKGVYRIS